MVVGEARAGAGELGLARRTRPLCTLFIKDSQQIPVL